VIIFSRQNTTIWPRSCDMYSPYPSAMATISAGSSSGGFNIVKMLGPSRG
jgi:hypothetical protein